MDPYNSSINKINKAFGNIKQAFFRNNDQIVNFDSKIEIALDKLTQNTINKDAYNYAENLRSHISNSIDSKSINTDHDSMLTGLFNSSENTSRFIRYVNADDIIRNIPQCSRALRVLTDSIISPDNITKESIRFETLRDSKDNETMIENLNLINSELNIDDEISTIVLESLKYGDCFVEVCNFNDKEVPITQSLQLTEGKDINFQEDFKIRYKTEKSKIHTKYKKDEFDILTEDTNDDTDFETKTISLKIVEDISDSRDDEIPNNAISLFETTEKNESNNNKEKNISELSTIRIIRHNPRKIVKIQTEKYKMCLGYLIMPYNSLGPLQNSNNNISSATMYSNMSTTSDIHKIYAEILKIVKKYVNGSDFKIDKKEMKELLIRSIDEIEKDENNREELKIRYVSPEKMIHFYIDNSLFYPYGEGIFEKTMFSAKLSIALKTAITVKRVVDSSEKLLINIESQIPRNMQNVVNDLKDTLTKRKYSLGDLDNISSIPTMLTSNEYFIVPSINGKKFIEFDTLQPTTNIRDASEELKYMRDEIVSSIDVPPSYVGIDENLGNKAALAHESFMFGLTVLNYQKMLSKHLFRLYSSIYKFIYEQNLKKEISINFPEPKMLFLEKETEQMDLLNRMIESGKTIGITKEYLKKKYYGGSIPELEDDEIKQTILDLQKGDKKPEPDPYGAGGGIGGF